MLKRVFRVLLFLTALSASALQWPVDIDSMSSSFLEDRDGVVQTGLVFEGYDTMHPFDNGEVVYRYIPEAYGALPQGDSSLLVLSHDNGFQSIYTGITGQETRSDRSRLSAGEFLKAPAESGDEGAGFCRFSIRDAKLNQIVNPLILLPVPADSRSPRLVSVILQDEDNSFELMSGEEELVLPAGNYSVYVKAEDFTNRGVRQMPYSFSLYNLGTLLLERKLDALQQQGGDRVFQDGTSMVSVFSMPEYLLLGDIVMTSGRSIMEISMEDIHGNEGSESFDIEVHR